MGKIITDFEVKRQTVNVVQPPLKKSQNMQPINPIVPIQETKKRIGCGCGR